MGNAGEDRTARRHRTHRLAAILTGAAVLVCAASGCTATASTARPTLSRTEAPGVNGTTASHAPTSSATDAAPVAGQQSAAAQKVAALTTREAAVARDVPKAGLVVASTALETPAGSVGFHLQVVATGDDDYEITTSAFHSDPPGEEYQLFLRQYDESIGSCVEDGVSFGYASWGGANSAETVPATVSLSSAGDDPSFLKDAVITETRQASDSTSSCLFRVVAVAPLSWSTPDRHPGLTIVDGGSRAGASGTVDVVGKEPRSYTVAAGDTVADVCARFGVTVRDLRYLVAQTKPAGDDLSLEAGQVLNLDPSAR